jgi:hypothetical protein
VCLLLHSLNDDKIGKEEIPKEQRSQEMPRILRARAVQDKQEE